MRPLDHNDFYLDELNAYEALRLTWWASGLKRTWYTINNKRVYGWELI